MAEPALPTVHLSEFEPVPQDVISSLPSGLVNKQMIVPLKKFDGHLIVAVSKTEGVVKPEGLAMVAGCPVEFVMAPIEEITDFIKRHYNGAPVKRPIMIPAENIIPPAPAVAAAPEPNPVLPEPIQEKVESTPAPDAPVILQDTMNPQDPEDTLALYVDGQTFDADTEDLTEDSAALYEIQPIEVQEKPREKTLPPSELKAEMPLMVTPPASAMVPSEVLKLVMDAVISRATEVLLNFRNGNLQMRQRIRGIYVSMMPGKECIFPAQAEKIVEWTRKVGEKMAMPGVEWIEHRQELKVGDEIYALYFVMSQMKDSNVLTVHIRSHKESVFSPTSWGMDPSQIKLFTEFLERSQGFILFTGSEREGLTENLHACARHLATPKRHVVAVEPHMEAWLSGVDQYFSNGDSDLFTQYLKLSSKHNPDVLIANPLEWKAHFELCLLETLKGRLVLGRSYATDCADALIQLSSMGVEPYLVGSAITAIISKRTLRLNCPVCQVTDPTAKSQARELGIPDAMQPNCFYKSTGCESCNQTGFNGQTDIFELLVMTPELRNLFNKDLRAETIRSQIKSSGLLTLRQVALHKAINGQTSLTEVIRSTPK